MNEHKMSSGLWVKTRFYREAHTLHAVTYVVAAGNPEIIRLSVDMRPIAIALEKYHASLHDKSKHPDAHVGRAQKQHRTAALAPQHHAPVAWVQAAEHADKKTLDKVFARVRGVLSHHANLAGGGHPLYDAVSAVVATAHDDQASLVQLLQALRDHYGTHHRSKLYKALVHSIANTMGHPMGAPSTPHVGAGFRDRLVSGDRLTINQALWSKNGRACLVMQPDSNLVLYAANRGPNGLPQPGAYVMWKTDTVNSGGTVVTMKADGNLVMQDLNIPGYQGRSGRLIWGTNTPGHAGGTLLLQDDGNLVMYTPNGVAYWSSNTQNFQNPEAGGGIWSGIGHAVEGVAKTKLVSMVGDAVKEVVSKAATVMTPISLVSHLLHGERIDHALLGELKGKLAVAKELAPYAETVASMVPGLGSGVAGAIAASAALAEGHSITDAMVEAVKKAVPGGAATAFAFDLGAKLARGGNLVKSTLESARNELPEKARAAFDAAVAVVHGQNLQKVLTSGISSLVPSLGPALKGFEKYSPSALAAFATAHAAFDSIQGAKSADTAVAKARSAAELVRKADVATAALGTKKATEALRANPDLAARINAAVRTTELAEKVPAAVIEAAKAQGRDALAKIVELYKTAKHDPDPHKREMAQKSVKILEIVAAHRTHLRAIAQANSGGVPGIHIDAHGNLKRGVFVEQPGKNDSFLYAKNGGGRGSWRELSPSEHMALAQTHATTAQTHHALAQTSPRDEAAQHRALAAQHAKLALAHQKVAPKVGCHVVGGSVPGLIGCACSHP